MKKTHIEKLREEINSDPELAAEFVAIERKLRPACLKVSAWHDALFPPESPTSKRRGGNKLAPSPEFMDAVCAIIDAKMGHNYEDAQSNFDRAMKSADPAFFLMMADASKYVRDMPQDVKKFADCVITAKRIAAGMMGQSGPLPSRGKVIDAVIKYLGYSAFGKEESTRWSEVMKAAGLSDLKRSSSARTGIPERSGVGRIEPNC